MNAVPATGDDFAIAAELIRATMEGFSDAALGLGSRELCLTALGGLFVRRGNRFSHDCTLLLKEDTRTAGLLLCFPGNEIGRRNRASLADIFSVYSFPGALRVLWNFLQSFTSGETEPDELYIAHLAVHPDFRRRGVGLELIEQAGKSARAANLGKLSLTVEFGNDGAIALYQKTGFRVVETVATPQFEKKFHFSGYYRMVKEI